jgi:predicted DCC family thiol-disulfide oxidoreductase YuxK
MGKNIVYFDGVCGLCNYFIDFLVRQDKHNKLLFAPLQGETAAKKLGINPAQEFNTIIFDKNGKLFYKSGAGLRILYAAGGIWKLLIVLLIFPPFLRNFVYDIIANNRYKWFGKKESCRMPTKEERVKFLP